MCGQPSDDHDTQFSHGGSFLVQLPDTRCQSFHLLPYSLRVTPVCTATPTKPRLQFRRNVYPLQKDCGLRALQAKVRPHSIDDGSSVATVPRYYPARFPLGRVFVLPGGNGSTFSVGPEPANQCLIAHSNFQSSDDRTFCGLSRRTVIDEQADTAFPINESGKIGSISIRKLFHDGPPVTSDNYIRYTGGNQ